VYLCVHARFYLGELYLLGLVFINKGCLYQ
jgi:hypothetical protein